MSNRGFKKGLCAFFLVLFTSFILPAQTDDRKGAVPYKLEFNDLAKRWDEAIPLGNGIIGSLLWQKGEHLRMSLDNVYLWDLRPMENLQTPEFKFSWVYEKWKNDEYRDVQEKFDVPYNKSPAPSKIPGAAMEFDVAGFGAVKKVSLSLDNALCTVNWSNDVTLLSFVHADKNEGWFKFEGVEKGFKPVLLPPAYNVEGEDKDDSPVTGKDLRHLGYSKGEFIEGANELVYIQDGWGDFKYKVHVVWTYENGNMIGKWSIDTSLESPKDLKKSGLSLSADESDAGFESAFKEHADWWEEFWGKSAIRIPDTVLEKQWYLEQYKFGSAARSGAPPISLQAVWTADNGKLPPWKGDFHHDLNTQLSYWPAYSGNHLDLEIGFVEWLEANKKNFKRYTKTYYETKGLSVPGVTTLTGEPMGGWIQYAFGPTTSAWLGHHFYLHWRYSMDRDFLKDHAYPWIKEVALFFDDISVKNESGLRQLPISSSPEIHNNSRKAWFGETTNFDLAAIRWTYEKAAELAKELGKDKEAKQWEETLKEWPYFAIDENEGLMVAPNHPYEDSHRHFSHIMAYHPYGIVDYSKGEKERQIIDNTIDNLLNVGSDYFTGYSFSWLGNLQARAFDGEGAANTLRIFAENFCLPNSFHVNGEQHNRGYSKFKYRPFTLEGNFAFAAGIQEMLIQSHTGVINIFPAIPKLWQEVGFEQLRAQGAFLVSAQRKGGKVDRITIVSEKGGVLKLQNPFGQKSFKVDVPYEVKNDVIIIEMKEGQTIQFTS